MTARKARRRPKARKAPTDGPSLHEQLTESIAEVGIDVAVNPPNRQLVLLVDRLNEHHCKLRLAAAGIDRAVDRSLTSTEADGAIFLLNECANMADKLHGALAAWHELYADRY